MNRDTRERFEESNGERKAREKRGGKEVRLAMASSAPQVVVAWPSSFRRISHQWEIYILRNGQHSRGNWKKSIFESVERKLARVGQEIKLENCSQ